jgi:hypothetical protein
MPSAEPMASPRTSNPTLTIFTARTDELARMRPYDRGRR